MDSAPLAGLRLPGAEESIRQSLLLSRGDFAILVTRPLAAAFLVATVVVMLLPLIVSRLRGLGRTVTGQ